MEQNKKNTLDEQLIDAAGQHNLQKVMDLIEKGANPNYVRYTDSNCWYSGNTHTALYAAVHTAFKNQSDFVNVIQYLLKKGANPNFKAVRGGWNHSTQYPLFSGVSYTINKFTETKQKIRFLQIFVKNGGNINQGQHHSRSKNWRGYNTSKNFLFEMLDGCGISSKMHQLVKSSQTFNFQEAKNSHYNSLKEQYQKQKAKNEEKEKEKEVEQVVKVEKQQSHQKEKKKQPDIQLIKAIINLGGSVNSTRSQHFWENYQNDHYEDQEDYSLSKYDTQARTQRETILHRCIMNNVTELAQLLIEKGAKVDEKCVFTVGKPAYPHQWPEKLKERKIKQKLHDLKQNEIYKNESVQQLQKAVAEQEKKRIRQRIESYQFEIYKCQRYQIQNQCPIRICQKQQVSCEQLAQIFNVSSEIKELLKNAPK